MADGKETAADVLELVADLAAVLAKRGGAVGMGAVAAAALLRTTAATIRANGESVDDVLKRVRQPRRLAMPWSKPIVPPPPMPGSDAEDTRRERPNSKAPKP